MKNIAVINCRTTQENCLQKQDFTEILSVETGLRKNEVKQSVLTTQNCKVFLGRDIEIRNNKTEMLNNKATTFFCKTEMRNNKADTIVCKAAISFNKLRMANSRAERFSNNPEMKNNKAEIKNSSTDVLINKVNTNNNIIARNKNNTAATNNNSCKGYRWQKEINQSLRLCSFVAN